MISKWKPGELSGLDVYFDIEAKGLLDAVAGRRDIHVIAIHVPSEGEMYVFADPVQQRDNPQLTWLDDGDRFSGDLSDGVEALCEANSICAHNLLGYDYWALCTAFPGRLPHPYEDLFSGSDEFPRFRDSLVLSKLLNPDQRACPQAYARGRGGIGGHGLENYGFMCGLHKPEHNDWSTLSDAMLERIMCDAEITSWTWNHLVDGEFSRQLKRVKRSGKSLYDALRVESVVALEIEMQAQRGVGFDMAAALRFFDRISSRMRKLESLIEPNLPHRVVTKKNSASLLMASRKAATKAEVFPGKPVWSHLADQDRAGFYSTCWSLTTKSGKAKSGVVKLYPEMAGQVSEIENPIVAGPFTPIKIEKVGFGSLAAIKRRIYSLGWQGVNPTESEKEYEQESGSYPYSHWGKIDEASIDAWEARGKVPRWVKALVKYYVLQHRLGLVLNSADLSAWRESKGMPTDSRSGRVGLRGLAGLAVDQETGMTFSASLKALGEPYWEECLSGDREFRIAARANSNATNTHRMAHKDVANIPRLGSLLGWNLRSLFIAGPGKIMLGSDAKSLELRMLADSMGSQQYIDLLMTPGVDMHQVHTDLANLPSRNHGKTLGFAVLYGAGAGHLAAVFSADQATAQGWKDAFYEKIPGLQKLSNDVEKTIQAHGHIRLLDGRVVKIRRRAGKYLTHTGVNCRLQGNGSICMKWTVYELARELWGQGRELPMVVNVHDEIQLEVEEREVDYWVELNHQCFARAGKQLGLRLALECDPMPGKNWLETH